MKKKSLKKLIQKPLRFHHQDIHEELDQIKRMLINVSNQMQELQQTIRESSNEDSQLSMREFYEHPWYKYKRELVESGGDSNNPERKIYTESITTRLGFSGGTATTQGPTN